MPSNLDPLPLSLTATPTRPLAGVTVLLVEDSRTTSEAVRLLSVRSGARIRRADTIQAAWRHLGVYQPTAIIVDLGLPDGSGLDLIHELVNASNRIPAILGTSGDDAMSDRVSDVGADGFLLKPIESLGVFQSEMLRVLPADFQAPRLRVVADDVIAPDDIAKQDDFTRVVDLLSEKTDAPTVEYVSQFLSSVACTTRDADLEKAAGKLLAPGDNQSLRTSIERLVETLQDRLKTPATI